MQIILLAVTLGLVCAAPSPQSQVEGDWRSILVAATNKKKVDRNGELSTLLRSLHCTDGPACATLTVRFFSSKNGVCTEYNIEAIKQENGDYYAKYFGDNYFRILDVKGDLIRFSNRNIDEKGVETRVLLVAGKRTALTEAEKAEFAEYVEKEGIAGENRVYVPVTDICPP